MEKTNDDSSLFERFSNLMDKNIKGVKIGCYSVAFIGLTIALRKVRPFSRFKKPSDIPKHFIKEERELMGTVERIEPNGALLMIAHKPLITIPGIRKGQLPVKIAGINVNGHGISWLQTLVAGNQVVFIPVKSTKDFAECKVTMQQNTHDKKRRTIDLGESLVSVGFGAIIDRPITKKDPNYRYYMRLKSAEESALKKSMGMKYYIKPTRLVIESVSRQLRNFAISMTKRIISVGTNKTTSKKIQMIAVT